MASHLTPTQQKIVERIIAGARKEDDRIVAEGRAFTRRVPYSKRRHAKLTADEERDWDILWVDYKNDGYNDEDASHLTWHYLQERHPRLKKYDDALP